jgi:hypothetical protein
MPPYIYKLALGTVKDSGEFADLVRANRYEQKATTPVTPTTSWPRRGSS